MGEAKADACKTRSDAEADAQAIGEDILEAAQEQADKIFTDAIKAAEPKASDKK